MPSMHPKFSGQAKHAKEARTSPDHVIFYHLRLADIYINPIPSFHANKSPLSSNAADPPIGGILLHYKCTK
jgi:hypothetical protein